MFSRLGVAFLQCLGATKRFAPGVKGLWHYFSENSTISQKLVAFYEFISSFSL